MRTLPYTEMSVLQWRNVISQKNGILNFTAVKISELALFMSSWFVVCVVIMNKEQVKPSITTQLTFLFCWLWLHVSASIKPPSGPYKRVNNKCTVITCRIYDTPIVFLFFLFFVGFHITSQKRIKNTMTALHIRLVITLHLLFNFLRVPMMGWFNPKHVTTVTWKWM
jgi:hypothetical protein